MPSNLRGVHELIPAPEAPPPVAFKTPSLRAIRKFQSFPLVPANKHCTFLHYKPVSVDCLYRMQVNGPRFDLVSQPFWPHPSYHPCFWCSTSVWDLTAQGPLWIFLDFSLSAQLCHPLSSPWRPCTIPEATRRPCWWGSFSGAGRRSLPGASGTSTPDGEEAWGRSSLGGRETEGREDTRDRKGETRPQAEAGGEDEVAVTLTQAFK